MEDANPVWVKVVIEEIAANVQKIETEALTAIHDLQTARTRLDNAEKALGAIEQHKNDVLETLQKLLKQS